MWKSSITRILKRCGTQISSGQRTVNRLSLPSLLTEITISEENLCSGILYGISSKSEDDVYRLK